MTEFSLQPENQFTVTSMDEEARENMLTIVNDSSKFLKQNLQCELVLSDLRNDCILNEEDIQTIESKDTDFEKTKKLIETLKKRDLSAIEKLIKALMKSVVQWFIGRHLAIKGECATVSRKDKADYDLLNFG